MNSIIFTRTVGTLEGHNGTIWSIAPDGELLPCPRRPYSGRGYPCADSLKFTSNALARSQLGICRYRISRQSDSVMASSYWRMFESVGGSNSYQARSME